MIATTCSMLLVASAAVAQADAPRPQFTLSKKTTCITEPLTARGFPDYAAAINRQLARGVTAKNNANVLFWQALGPHPESATMDPEFFRLMGIGEPAEDDQHFINLAAYLLELEKLAADSDEYTEVIRQQGRAGRKPWKTADLPAIAGWLAANEGPLTVVIEGSRRPKYFSPLHVPENAVPGGLISVLLPAVQSSREFARALTARAMLHLGEGRLDAAWQDLLACHRLGRHIGRGPTLVEGLVGIAINNIANDARSALLKHAPPSSEQAATYLRDLDALPPLPSLARKTFVSERYFFLDTTLAIAQGDSRVIADYAGGGGALPPYIEAIPFDLVEWDVVLRIGNEWFDRIENAIETKDRAQRSKKLADIASRIKKLETQFADPQKQLKQITETVKKSNGPSKELSAIVAHFLIRLFTPAWNAVMRAEGRALVGQANSRTAIVLAAYHRGSGRYPARLAELVPKYLKRLPVDHYSGKPLRYRRSQDGYLLYSVGQNEKDENGEWQGGPSKGDDLGYRVP